MTDSGDVSWEINYQGKPCYVAYCECECLLISQEEDLQVADAVPRRSCELTDDDKQQLERLNQPQSSWKDDTSIMAARFAFDKRFTKVQIERSSYGRLRKTKVEEVIRNTINEGFN